LRLVNGEDIAEIELLIVLALLPRDLLEPAGKALRAHPGFHAFSARVVLGLDPHPDDLPPQPWAVFHQPEAAVEQALALVVAQAHELVALQRQRPAQAPPLTHALIAAPAA